MTKNIILCSDGTGNVGGKAEGTNVWRLFLAVDQSRPANPDEREQIAFYDDGVGTQSFKLLRLIGGVFGWGISRNIERLYGFLIQNYEPGDDLYLFGFSRGAFTVRVLADLISLCGIAGKKEKQEGKPDLELSPSEIGQRAHHALQAYKNQKREWLGSATAAADFKKKYSRKDNAGELIPISIRCVGVWDTVDAVGLPFDELTAAFRWLFSLRFRDQKLSPSVQHAYQALSIDEARQSFQPVLWEPTAPEGQTVEQVWFPGVHANVGGGYPKDQLALISLDWMLAKVGQAPGKGWGVRFHPNLLKAYHDGANVQGQLYDSRSGLGAYHRYGPRRLERVGEPTQLSKGLATKEDTPQVHVSALQRIAGGIDGYAPPGIPKEYEVVDNRGPVTPPKPETPAGKAERIKHMEIAYDLIWWRRVGYYLFLISTLGILYCGWVLSFEACPKSRSAVTTVLEPVRAIAPWKLEDVVVGYQKAPWFLLVFVVYGGLIWWATYLRNKTRDVAVAAWRLGFGHPVSSKGWRGLHSLVARPIRTSRWMRQFARVFKQHLVPPLTLAVVILALFGRWAWFECNLPKPEASATLVELSRGQRDSTEFDTKTPYHNTGWLLVPGERYCIAVETTADWKDNDLPATPRGLSCDYAKWRKPALWLSVPLRRVVQAPWFQLRGEIGLSGHVQIPIDDGTEFEATEKGELFLYVNDVPGHHDNNHGTATVTIIHLPRCPTR